MFIASKKFNNFFVPGNLALIAILLFILFSRILPFALYGEAPLGYDAGFYRYYLEKPFDGFPKQPEFGLQKNALVARILMDILRLVGFSSDQVLYGFYIFLNILLAFLLYFVVKDHFNKKTALVSLFIYGVSFTQYLAYWFALWKMFLALNFLFVSIYFLNKNRILSLLFLFLIAFTNTSTFIFFYFLWTLFYIYTAVRAKKIEFWPTVIIFAALIIFVIGNFSFLLKNINILIFRNGFDITSVKEGSFIQLSDYFHYARFYIPFGLLGFFLSFHKKRFNIFSLMFLMAITWVLAKFYFFQRVFIFLDLAMIIWAAVGLAELFNRLALKVPKRVLVGASTAIFILASFFYLQNVFEQEPLIAKQELEEIKKLSLTLPDDAVIIPVSQSINSIVHGYSQQKVVLAGLRNDLWNDDDWRNFRVGNSETQKALAAKYKGPLVLVGLKSQGDLFTRLDKECFWRKPDFTEIIVYDFICG